MSNKYDQSVIDDAVKKLVAKPKVFEVVKLHEENTAELKCLELAQALSDFVPEMILRCSKHDVYAKELRFTGNSFFKKKTQASYYYALELYNKSIAFAATNSANMSIAYANRSAVYIEWGMHELCLLNIELARSTGTYPKLLHPKLERREKACRVALDKGPPPFDVMQTYDYVPEVLQPPHKDVPIVTAALSIHSNKKYGRYVTTDTQLKPGQIVAIEEAFLNVLETPNVFKRCSHCFAENELHLIPCNKCTSAMFCSKKCLDEAAETFHGWECPIIDYIQRIFNFNHLMAMRYALKAFLLFDTADKLVEFIEKFGAKKSSVFTPLSSEEPDITKEQCVFHQTYSFEMGDTMKRTPTQRAHLYLFAVIVLQKFMEHTTFAEKCVTKKHKNLFMELLLRYVQISPVNTQGDFINGTEAWRYASGSFPFSSLLNHSCAPNVVPCGYSGKVVILVMRPIKAGGQLFINYGPHHHSHEASVRRIMLKHQYFFECDCEACTRDYDIFSRLPVVDIPYCEEDQRKLDEWTQDILLETIAHQSDYLEKYDSFYPCLQVSTAQELLKKNFFVLLKNICIKAKKIYKDIGN